MSASPTALLARGPQFVSIAGRAEGARANGNRVPEALPDRLDTIQDWEGPTASSSTRRATPPTTVFITVDTEDTYFTKPHLITGQGVGSDYGVYGILDELDAVSAKGTFFVNVYEKENQPSGVIERVVRDIAERGHEVGLHTHPSPALDFFRRPLFHFSRQEQRDILHWGAELIDHWTGQPVTSFRAGAYALNDDTFTALEDIGIAIDSSCFFPSPNNRISRFVVNAIGHRGTVTEIPITTVLQAWAGGKLTHSKLDLDWLSTKDLTTALASISSHGMQFAMFMMHSFSFLNKAAHPPEEAPSSNALFTSETLFGRYVEIYGAKPARRQAFATFLERVTADPALEIRTLRDALSDLRAAETQTLPDIVPIIHT